MQVAEGSGETRRGRYAWWRWLLAAATTLVVLACSESSLESESASSLPLDKESFAADPAPTPIPAAFGVNLAGGEFGDDDLPGTYDQDYTYPTAREMDYYKRKGRLIVRVPFRWERLQRTLSGPLDPAEVSRIDAVIANARSRGMRVLLDCHNYGRYKINGTDEQILGTARVPDTAFADLWLKIADRYKNESAVYGYGLMNEPHDMGDDERWPAAAQAAVDAIRKVDIAHTIFVAGDHWSGAQSWRDTSNEHLSIRDPMHKLVYEAHQYFDDDNNGIYDRSYDEEGAYDNVGVDRVRPFVEWLREKGETGFVGEFGVPGDDPRWDAVLVNFLSYLDSNDVGGTYWAGGPWWGDYPLSIEPTDDFATDKPQMLILQRYFGGSELSWVLRHRCQQRATYPLLPRRCA